MANRPPLVPSEVEAPASLKRRAYRTTLDTLFHALVRWLAPVLVFTTEEAWGTRFPDAGSAHLLEWPELPTIEAEDAKWAELRALRTQVTEAIEPLRRDKVVRSSNEARVLIPDATLSLLDTPPSALSELFIVASVEGNESSNVEVERTTMLKCGRCWRHLPEVVEDDTLCGRCEEMVNG